MRDSTDHQQAVFALAKQRGINLSTSDRAMYRVLSIEVRSIAELSRDATKLTRSVIRTKVLGRVVSLDVLTENKSICKSNECGKFREQKDSRGDWIACDACNCMSNELETKQQDPTEHCPIINPKTKGYYWDNRGKASSAVSVSAPTPRGDSHG